MSLYFSLCTKVASVIFHLLLVIFNTVIIYVYHVVCCSRDVGILIPVLSSLCYQFFPSLSTFWQISSKLHMLACYSPILSPAEVLIAIHGIDPEKDGIALKKAPVMDACNACFELRQVFTQQVLAKVEQIPLPLLFMLTVLQAIGAFPALILSRLVTKQI
ncbi:hypothetical protein MKW92_003085 [Papaver armeniacum]|nr:hypothetical protein MKW92_003085 [Papaver armeniacum]